MKVEQGDANAQASAGNAEDVSKGVGRPQIGVSRAAQKAWANYRRSPKGQKQLNSLPADQVEDFRLTWLVDKEKAMNEVKQSAKTTITEADSEKGGWRTGPQIASLEGRQVEDIAELLAGLAKRPSRFSHLKKNDDYAEYWYEFADTKKKERKKESAMQATSTSYLGLNVETMADLAQDLGSEVVVAEGQPPSKKHKANSKLGLPAPSPKKGAEKG